MSLSTCAPHAALYEVLREEWQNLAREISLQNPEDACPHLHALLVHAQRRIDEYSRLLEGGLSLT